MENEITILEIKYLSNNHAYSIRYKTNSGVVREKHVVETRTLTDNKFFAIVAKIFNVNFSQRPNDTSANFVSYLKKGNILLGEKFFRSCAITLKKPTGKSKDMKKIYLAESLPLALIHSYTDISKKCKTLIPQHEKN